jgi:hypothetical protein
MGGLLETLRKRNRRPVRAPGNPTLSIAGLIVAEGVADAE